MSACRTGALWAALSTAMLIASPVSAGESTHLPQRVRSVEVEPNQSLPGANLKLRLHALGERRTRSADGDSRFARTGRISDAEILANGQRVEICFEAAKDGYVTVWSDNLVDAPSLIYPNARSGHGTSPRAAKVIGGEEVCIGDKGPPEELFDLVVRIKSHSKMGQLHVNWTPTESEQVSQDEYVRVVHPDDKRSLSRSAARTNIANATITYTIAD